MRPGAVELQALGPELGMPDDAVTRAESDARAARGSRFFRVTKRFFDVASLVLFLLMIAAPLVGRLTGIASPPSTAHEHRLPAPLPSLPSSAVRLEQFPANFDAFFNDAFGFRNELLRGYSMLKVFGLRDSSSTSVVLGRDGWLFFDGRFSERCDPIADARGTRPLDAPHLERLVNRFTHRQKWLAQRGIAYVVMVVPNKETVYSECLPSGLERVPSATSPLDQVKPRLLAGGIELIDLRDTFAAAKQKASVYYRTDTHWNWYGTMLAYQALMPAVARKMPPTVDRALLAPTPPDGFDSRPVVSPGMGLAKMLALEDRLPESSIELIPRAPARATIAVLDAEAKYRTTLLPDPRLPRAVMLHTSFSIPLIGLVAEHFSQIGCHWTLDFDTDLIERVKPAIVIDEIGERGLRLVVSDDVPKYAADAGDGRVDRGKDEPAPIGETRALWPASPPAVATLPPPQSPSAPSASTPAIKAPPAQPDPDVLRQRFEASTNVCMTWKAGTEFKLSQQIDDLRTTGDGSLAMKASGSDPQIYLPEFEASQPMPWIARVEITSPVATAFQLFWRPPSAVYTGERSALRPMTPGRNVIFVELNDPQMSHDLRIDPGAAPGEYVLHSIEIRSCPVK